MTFLFTEIDSPSLTPLKKSKSVYKFPAHLLSSFKKDKLNAKSWSDLTQSVESYQVVSMLTYLTSLCDNLNKLALDQVIVGSLFLSIDSYVYIH